MPFAVELCVTAGNLGDQVHVTAPLCAFLGVSVTIVTEPFLRLLATRGNIALASLRVGVGMVGAVAEG